MHKRKFVVVCAWILGFLAASCTAPLIDPVSPVRQDELLSGQLLFDRQVDAIDGQPTDMLRTNALMRSIADRVRLSRGSDKERIDQLLEELKKEGLFAPGSLSDSTRTASELFQVRDGNCLSFTSLFVAIGRHAGLTVSFQLVDVPPEFDAIDGVLVHQTHINASVQADRTVTSERSITVDFNETNAEGYRRRLVSDDYAYALYRSNIAIDHWRSGMDERAFAHLKAAIELEPGIADLWSNLGAMYLRAQHPETAADAYSIALSIDPQNTTALNGLAAHYSSVGQEWRSRQLSRLSKAQRKGQPLLLLRSSPKSICGEQKHAVFRTTKYGGPAQIRRPSFLRLACGDLSPAGRHQACA